MEIVDLANDYAEQELADRLFGRVQYVGQSATHCEDCDCEIPLLRREAVPGVRLCLACQEYAEAINGR